MRVNFPSGFFYTGETVSKPGGLVSGKFYRPGTYTVPENMKLPKSAKLVKDDGDKVEVSPETLKEYDEDRIASDQLQNLNNQIVEQTAKVGGIETYEEHEQKRTKRKKGRPKKYE